MIETTIVNKTAVAPRGDRFMLTFRNDTQEVVYESTELKELAAAKAKYVFHVSPALNFSRKSGRSRWEVSFCVSLKIAA